MRFVAVLPDCHGINRWPIAGPSVKDHKPAGFFLVHYSERKGSTKVMIGILEFYDDFCLLHFYTFLLLHYLIIILEKHILCII